MAAMRRLVALLGYIGMEKEAVAASAAFIAAPST